jgi:hypothetical protein
LTSAAGRKDRQIVSTVTAAAAVSPDELITLAGSELRGKLGVGPTAAAEEVAVKAELPPTWKRRASIRRPAEAAQFRALAAQDRFEKAAAADPRHAMSYAYLASA